ncbi:MAG: hypothetical protein ACKKL6_00535 [Candidatus Komeilibacteria bacterium]
MNIYLDIDGVLIHDALDKYQQPADGLVEFLKYITNNHDVYWLTTHCKGDTEHLLEYLRDRISVEAMEYARLIKPTTWGTWKTEGIDFSKDFRWLDDDVYRLEHAALKERNCENKLINIDLVKNPNQLTDIINEL